MNWNVPMHRQFGRARIFALLFGFTALVLAGWGSADPPTRVARLGHTSGVVSFSPAGENDWVLATMNRPLITGDRLWVDARARAELQVGSAAIQVVESIARDVNFAAKGIVLNWSIQCQQLLRDSFFLKRVSFFAVHPSSR